MLISPARLHYLLQQYADNNCTKKELQELLQAVEEAKNDPDLQHSLQDIWKNIGENDVLPDLDREKIFNHIIPDTKARVLSAKGFGWWRAAAAAILILISGTGTYLYFTNTTPPEFAGKLPGRSHDIAPGSNKAILTLADGSHIVLDSVHNSSLPQQGNAKLISQDSGQLIYRTESGGRPLPATQYNTIATPKGGQYQIILPDGTKVWLNAASSLRFPTSFSGGQRQVDLRGEAYFEVAKNKSMPFKVHVIPTLVEEKNEYPESGPEEDIEVLGTRFNVNAYGDEADIRTTLLEGSVKVIGQSSDGKKEGGSRVLQPGQQMRLDRKGVLHFVADADAEAAVAWKDGYFQFEGVGIEAVMRQLARWYDVEISYGKGPVPERQFAGQIQRGSNLSEVLHILEESNVHFRIEGKKVVVTP